MTTSQARVSIREYFSLSVGISGLNTSHNFFFKLKWDNSRSSRSGAVVTPEAWNEMLPYYRYPTTIRGAIWRSRKPRRRAKEEAQRPLVSTWEAMRCLGVTFQKRICQKIFERMRTFAQFTLLLSRAFWWTLVSMRFRKFACKIK